MPDFVKYSFVLGVLIILSSIWWTGYRTKEYPPDNIDPFTKSNEENSGVINAFKEIFHAVKEMPLAIKQI